MLNSPYSPRYSRPSRSGFTLLEVVVVILIMIVLMTVLATVTNTTTKAIGLTTAGDNVYNKLVEVQQTAIARSKDVEVRFYQYAEESGLGTAEVRAIGFLVEDETGVMLPLSPPLELEAPIVITPGNTQVAGTANNLSTLISDSSAMVTDPDSPLAPIVNYTWFRYRPDGSTSLAGSTSSGDTWHLTIVDELTYLTGKSDNFYTIKIDPFTGRLFRYRPN